MKDDGKSEDEPSAGEEEDERAGRKQRVQADRVLVMPRVYSY